jgi:DNA topoisomerase IB
VLFDFVAKGGKQRAVSIRDPRARDAVRALKMRRNGGDELLAFRDRDGWHDVRAADVNRYIKDVTGGTFTAKDFRTWHATVLAALALAARVDVAPSLQRRRAISSAVKEVAEYLGNTPTVCRASYIDPRVLDRYLEGVTLASVAVEIPEDGELDPAAQAQVEAAVLDLVDGGVDGGAERLPEEHAA